MDQEESEPSYLDWTEEDIECLGESDWPPLAASDKIRECGFFLGLMRQNTDWDQFRWLTSAFLEAARAAMDWMAYAAHHYYEDDSEGNSVRDDCYVKPLAKFMIIDPKKDGRVFVCPSHPLLKELCKRRKETAHRGPLWIKPKRVKAPTEFIFKEGERLILQFCNEVYDILVTIPEKVHEEVWAREDNELPE